MIFHRSHKASSDSSTQTSSESAPQKTPKHHLSHHHDDDKRVVKHHHEGDLKNKVDHEINAMRTKAQARHPEDLSLSNDRSKTGYGKGRVMAIFASLMIAMFVGSLAETMTSTALPTIVGDLGGVEQMQWVTTAYILASTISLPIYGKIGDLIGRKYLMVTAIGLYVIGSTVCVFTSTIVVLIIARAVSGVGGGGIIILSEAIIADVTTPRERGKYLGFIGSVFSVSATIGPLLGGLFVQVLGWRWLFAANAILAAIALVTTAILIKQKRQKYTTKTDVAGIFTMVVWVVSLILVVSWGGTVYAWNSPEVIGAIIIFVIFAIAFVFIERRAAEPIIPIMLFKNRNFLLVTIATFIVMIGQIGVTTYLPTYLQIVDGLTPIEAGLMTFPMVIGLTITAIATGFIAAKTGHYKWMTIACLAVTGVGLGLLGTMNVDTGLVLIGVYLFILGFGIGFGEQIFVLIVQNEFPAKMVGTATGGNNFFRQIGSTIGAALVGTMFTSRLAADLASQLPASDNINIATITPQALDSLSESVRHLIETGYSDALAPIFMFLVPLFAVGVIICCFIKENPLATTIEHGGQTDSLRKR